MARGSDTGDERQAPVRCWCLPLLALAVMLLGSCAEDAAACAGRTWDLRTPPSREDVGMPPGREWVAWECDDPREMTFRLPGEAALRVPSTLVTFDAYGARRPETGDPTTADVHTGPLGLDAAARLATGILRRLGTDAGEIGEWRARAAAATSTDYVRSLFIRSRVGYLGVEVRTTYMPLSKSAFVHIIFNFTPPPGE